MALTTGRLVRSFVAERTVRAVVVEATAPAEKVRNIHGLGPDAARLAAETLVATALMSAHTKGRERLALQVQGEEPRIAVSMEVTADGALRGRATPTDVVCPPGTGIRGLLLAIKSDDRQEQYRGLSQLRGETLERSLADHLTESMQVVDSVLRVGVKQADDGRIRFAAGMLVERLPEHPVHPWITTERFEEIYAGARTVDVSDLMTEYAFGKLCGQPVEVLEARTLDFDCWCSREKVEAMLGSLGGDTLCEMIREDHGAEVSCHFCTEVYRFDEAQLTTLRDLYYPAER